MGLIISLVIVGLILILAEILLIPGVGIAGVLGVLSMGGSCFYAFHEFGNLTGGVVTGINAILLVVLLVYVLRAKTWKRMTLETNIDAKAVADESAVVAVGDKGRTLTRLAPMGSVRFGDNVAEVKAIEGMIDPGTDVEVVMIEDSRIVVRTARDE
ncbi:MAG: serine protease [Bacteroidales bacterium]|nr:serine protease [Bacteroidales bacterium]